MSKIVGVTVGTPLSLSRIKQEIAPDIQEHEEKKNNPHCVTKDQVGLGNVDNTSDIDKPVSAAQATAIADAKKAGTEAKEAADNAQSTADNALPKVGGAMSGNLDMTGNRVTNVGIPVEDGDGVNRAFLVDYVDSKRRVAFLNLLASGWSSNAPYTQTISVAGITELDMPQFGVVYSSDVATALIQKEAFALVDDLETENGKVKFICFEEKPTVDIPVQLEVQLAAGGASPASDVGGSVQSDWNQTDESQPDFIKNKTHGKFFGDTLTEPAHNEDELSQKIESGELIYTELGFVKISDAILTPSDLSNGCVISVAGVFLEIPAEEIYIDEDLVVISEYFFIIPESLAGVELDGMFFPEAGTYTYIDFMILGFSLTIPGYTGFLNTKKLDSEYFPDVPKFYYNERNERIYNDANLTIMTTRADILPYLNERFAIVIPIEGIDAATYYPLTAMDTGEYVLVGIYDATGYNAIYTAERTE